MEWWLIYLLTGAFVGFFAGLLGIRGAGDGDGDDAVGVLRAVREYECRHGHS